MAGPWIRWTEALGAWWWAKREGLPLELRRGRLVLSECKLESMYPVPLCGRVDQAFRLDGGRGALVLMDTKARRLPLVTEDIRVQLSVYRVLLMHNPPPELVGVPVADWGVVRFKGRRAAAEYRRVRLMPEVEIIDRHRARRRALAQEAAG